MPIHKKPWKRTRCFTYSSPLYNFFDNIFRSIHKKHTFEKEKKAEFPSISRAIFLGNNDTDASRNPCCKSTYMQKTVQFLIIIPNNISSTAKKTASHFQILTAIHFFKYFHFLNTLNFLPLPPLVSTLLDKKEKNNAKT